MNTIIKIQENVFHIYESLGVYCTLILGSKAALLIDTGFGFGDIYTTVKSLTDLPVKVINTHGHVDHIQGNKFFDEVMLHKEDNRILHLYSSIWVKTWIYLGTRKRLNVEEKKNVSKFFKTNRQHIVFIHDGDLIDLGDVVLEVLHTPGHTRGSICLLDKTDRLLFAGDSVSSHVWLFLKESTTIQEYIKSIMKLMRRKNEFDTIVASHSPASFRPTILEKLVHCANNISIDKSTLFNSHLAGKAFLYSEGFEKIQQKYGYNSFEEFQKHALEIDPKEIADSEFVSIAYSKNKL